MDAEWCRNEFRSLCFPRSARWQLQLLCSCQPLFSHLLFIFSHSFAGSAQPLLEFYENAEHLRPPDVCTCFGRCSLCFYMVFPLALSVRSLLDGEGCPEDPTKTHSSLTLPPAAVLLLTPLFRHQAMRKNFFLHVLIIVSLFSVRPQTCLTRCHMFPVLNFLCPLKENKQSSVVYVGKKKGTILLGI